jgi:hypothetical protein
VLFLEILSNLKFIKFQISITDKTCSASVTCHHEIVSLILGIEDNRLSNWKKEQVHILY